MGTVEEKKYISYSIKIYIYNFIDSVAGYSNAFGWIRSVRSCAGSVKCDGGLEDMDGSLPQGYREDGDHADQTG